MRHEQMPHDGLERFRVRRHALGVDRRDDDADVRDLRRVATFPPYNPAYGRALVPRVLERAHDVGAYVMLEAPTTDRKDEHHVVARQVASLEPVRKHGLPAVVVDPR